MSDGGNPWADPATPTEPGAPYAGPPDTGPAPRQGPPGYPQPPGYGGPGYGAPGPGWPGYGPPAYAPAPYGSYGWSPYGPPWGPPPAPRRSGQVVASAVIAFVQAGLVALASAYVLFFASIVGLATGTPEAPPTTELSGLAREGTVLAVVQILSATLLVIAGILALNRRGRPPWVLLIAAHGVQIVLALYWAIRLLSVVTDVPGPDPGGALVAFTLLFAAGPAVGLGLVLLGPGRRWFTPAVPRA